MYNLYMSEMAVSDAREQLAAVIESARRTGEPVYLTRRGQPVAVLLDPTKFERLVEDAEAALDRAELLLAREQEDFVLQHHRRLWAAIGELEEDNLGVKFRLLKELLRRSDFISLHVPLNASTKHLIGAEELALMKPSAIIVNTSRGPVIDEKALHVTLAAHKIFAAGLDVFDQEPPPANNPLFTLDNVVLTAHFAGPTSDNHTARFRNAFDNCQRVARGEKPLWIIPELA